MDIFANEYTKKLTFVYLISDFQNGSYKTGLLRSRWMANFPQSNFIDISNDVRLNNLTEAAFIADQLTFSPSHQHVVLLKVGNTSDSVVFQSGNVLYLLPNNGLIGMLGIPVKQESLYLCSEQEELKAASLFLNNNLSELKQAGQELEIRYARQANINGDLATAYCIHSDKLGNCYFNFKREQFEQFANGRRFVIRIQYIPGVEFKQLSNSIRDAQQGEAIVKFSNSGYLKLQINQGNAKQLFRIKDDTRIIIELQ